MATEMLHAYMHDHHAGAAAGVDLFRRVASGHSDAHTREVVGRLGEQTAEDKRELEQLMRLVGTSPPLLKGLVTRVGETVARFKPNLRLVSRSPLSDLLELEALTLAVTGKELGWKALLDLGDPRLPRERLEALADRARDQGEQLEALRLECTDALRRT